MTEDSEEKNAATNIAIFLRESQIESCTLQSYLDYLPVEEVMLLVLMCNNGSSVQIIASPGSAAFHYAPLIICSVSRWSSIFQVKILCIYFKRVPNWVTQSPNSEQDCPLETPLPEAEKMGSETETS